MWVLQAQTLSGYPDCCGGVVNSARSMRESTFNCASDCMLSESLLLPVFSFAVVSQRRPSHCLLDITHPKSTDTVELSRLGWQMCSAKLGPSVCRNTKELSSVSTAALGSFLCSIQSLEIKAIPSTEFTGISHSCSAGFASFYYYDFYFYFSMLGACNCSATQ